MRIIFGKSLTWTTAQAVSNWSYVFFLVTYWSIISFVYNWMSAYYPCSFLRYASLHAHLLQNFLLNLLLTSPEFLLAIWTTKKLLETHCQLTLSNLRHTYHFFLVQHSCSTILSGHRVRQRQNAASLSQLQLVDLCAQAVYKVPTIEAIQAKKHKSYVLGNEKLTFLSSSRAANVFSLPAGVPRDGQWGLKIILTSWKNTRYISEQTSEWSATASLVSYQENIHDIYWMQYIAWCNEQSCH